MKLINLKTKQRIGLGETVTTIRNEVAKLINYDAPSYNRSAGSVYISINNGLVLEFLPATIGCKFID